MSGTDDDDDDDKKFLLDLPNMSVNNDLWTLFVLCQTVARIALGFTLGLSVPLSYNNNNGGDTEEGSSSTATTITTRRRTSSSSSSSLRTLFHFFKIAFLCGIVIFGITILKIASRRDTSSSLSSSDDNSLSVLLLALGMGILIEIGFYLWDRRRFQQYHAIITTIIARQENTRQDETTTTTTTTETIATTITTSNTAEREEQLDVVSSSPLSPALSSSVPSPPPRVPPKPIFLITWRFSWFLLFWGCVGMENYYDTIRHFKDYEYKGPMRLTKLPTLYQTTHLSNYLEDFDYFLCLRHQFNNSNSISSSPSSSSSSSSRLYQPAIRVTLEIGWGKQWGCRTMTDQWNTNWPTWTACTSYICRDDDELSTSSSSCPCHKDVASAQNASWECLYNEFQTLSLLEPTRNVTFEKEQPPWNDIRSWPTIIRYGKCNNGVGVSMDVSYVEHIMKYGTRQKNFGIVCFILWICLVLILTNGCGCGTVIYQRLILQLLCGSREQRRTMLYDVGSNDDDDIVQVVDYDGSNSSSSSSSSTTNEETNNHEEDTIIDNQGVEVVCI